MAGGPEGDARVLRSLLLEVQSIAVHAIAQAGGRGAVVEHVAKMGVALRAAYLRARHGIGLVLVQANGVIVHRSIEAWPSRAGIVFGLGGEKRAAAGHAAIEAFALVVPIGAGEGTLGAVLARDVILLGRQVLAPLLVGFLDLWAGLASHHYISVLFAVM